MAPQPVAPQWTPEQIAAWQAAQPAAPVVGPEQQPTPATFGQPVPAPIPPFVATVAPEVVAAFEEAQPAPVEPKPARKGRPPKTVTEREQRLSLLCSCASANMAPHVAAEYLALLEGGAQ